MITDSREARDIGRFIRARREKTQASDYGALPARRRHVPHLTQGELAEITDVSTVVISQVELGRYPNLTRQMLLSIAEALQLTEQQRTFLVGLFEPRPDDQKTRQPAPEWLVQLIDQIAHPVLIVNPAFDLVGINKKAHKIFENFDPQVADERNGAAAIFQVPAIREFIQDWDNYAASVVSGIKMHYAMMPEWRGYIESLIPRWEQTDPLFHELWMQDDPLIPPSINKQFNHGKMGTLNVQQILTDVLAAPGLTRIDLSPVDDETRQKFARL